MNGFDMNYVDISDFRRVPLRIYLSNYLCTNRIRQSIHHENDLLFCVLKSLALHRERERERERIINPYPPFPSIMAFI